MTTRFSKIIAMAITLIVILIPIGSLAATKTVLSDDFESTTSYFTTRTSNFSSTYQTSEIILASNSTNHVWQLGLKNGATAGSKTVEAYTKDYNSYNIPSTAVDVTYQADVWVVNNNKMPDQVFVGANFGYRDRIMRIRFAWDTKAISYQWTTGKNEVTLPQSFTYGKWYTIKIVYHVSSQTCDIYVNNIVQSLGYSTIAWTDSNVNVNGYNPLIKFNLLTKTTNLPLVLNNPIRANFDNVSVSYTYDTTTTAVPETGDHSNITLFIVLLALSFGTLLTLSVLHFRKVKRSKLAGHQHAIAC